MPDDHELTDVDLQAEIDLVGALVLAAAHSDGPLTQDAIDAVLGVVPAGPSPVRGAVATGPAD